MSGICRTSTIADVHSTQDAWLAMPNDLSRPSTSLASEPAHADQLSQERQAAQWLRLVRRGNWSAIKALLSDSNIVRFINAANAEGRTALMQAVCAQRLDVVQALRSNTALRVHDADNNGDTALMLAAYIGNVELVAALQDVDVNGTDYDGDSALIIAATTDRVDVVASLLKAPEIDLNIVNKHGLNALHCAVLNNQRQIIGMLLEADNIALNSADEDGHTALMLAVASGHLEAAELLLQDPRIDINIKDRNNRTALAWALGHGDMELSARLQQAALAKTAEHASRTAWLPHGTGNNRWRLSLRQFANCCWGRPQTVSTDDIPLMTLPQSKRT